MLSAAFFSTSAMLHARKEHRHSRQPLVLHFCAHRVLRQPSAVADALLRHRQNGARPALSVALLRGLLQMEPPYTCVHPTFTSTILAET